VPRQPAPGAGEAEDGQPVQDDGLRAGHAGEEAKELLQLPRTLGVDPSDGEAIIANNGRYGPYVQKGKDFRNIAGEEQLLTISLDEAVAIFSQPKVFRRGGGANLAAKGPLREFGIDPISGKPVVAKDGKFGVYVTDGETNASLSKGDRLDAMEPERAYELLVIRREAIIEKGGAPAKRASATKKAAAKKAAPAKKAGRPRRLPPRKPRPRRRPDPPHRRRCRAGPAVTRSEARRQTG
jgi:DNA topoisomerase-1